MKKNLPVLVLVVLCLSLLLGACQRAEKPNDNTLSVPLVGNDGSKNTASDVKDTYPAEGDKPNAEVQNNADPAKIDPEQAYPVKENNPNFDAEMEAWVKKLFGDKHTLDFVLSQKKSAEEWRAHFMTPEHEHLKLSGTQLNLLIDWLLERTK